MYIQTQNKLLLDGEDSTTSEKQSLEQFTHTDAIINPKRKQRMAHRWLSCTDKMLSSIH
ncbi:hypothetical protein Hanom_Chr08g00704651 [Helianthus anomalus]